MESNKANIITSCSISSSRIFWLLTTMVVIFLLFGFATCDIEQDKQKCTNQLVAVATCLPYVTGESMAPPVDCCTGFRQVLDKSRECVCLLIKDRDDPSLGIKLNITRALSLPVKCNAPANQTIADCPAILHLPPNSPDAKVFQEFASGNTAPSPSSAGVSSSGGAAVATSSVNPTSDGGKGKRLESIGLFSGMLLIALTVVTYLVHNT